MKSKEELVAFCEGYRLAAMANLPNKDLSDLDEWVQWDAYEINLFGSYYGIRLNDDKQALSVDVYPRDWHDVLPDALHTFDITGESK